MKDSRLRPAFRPGFRFSRLDAVVLLVATIAAGALAPFAGWLSVAILFVVGHFFLFCNVLRMSRPLELIWAGLFCALAIPAIFIEIPAWPIVFLATLGATIVVGLIQIRLRSYHGVAWQTFNPDLPHWWQSRHSE